VEPGQIITIAVFAGYILVVALAKKIGGLIAAKIAAIIYLWGICFWILSTIPLPAGSPSWEVLFMENLLENPYAILGLVIPIGITIAIWRYSPITEPKFRWRREGGGEQREEGRERPGALMLTVNPSHVRLRGDGKERCTVVAEAYDERGPRTDANFRFSLIGKACQIWQTGNRATLQSSLTLEDMQTRVSCSASTREQDGSIMTSTPQYVDVEVMGLLPRLTLSAIPGAVAASSENRVTINAAYEESGEPTQPRSNIIFKTLKGEEAGRLNIVDEATAIFTPTDGSVEEGDVIEVTVQGATTVPELRSQVRGEATFTVGLRHLSVIDVEKGIWKRY